MNLEVLRTIPLMQKMAFVVLVLAGIVVMFYYYVFEPKSIEIASLQGEIGKLDTEIQTLTIKVKHLDELIAANKQLEIELAKKKERLPPEEEAVMLLKQVSDLGIRLGLDIKLWKPGTRAKTPPSCSCGCRSMWKYRAGTILPHCFSIASTVYPESSRSRISRWGCRKRIRVASSRRRSSI